jgi:hypothetical protein
MGDAFGQISLWELGDGKIRESPVCFLKNDEDEISIRNIEFDNKASVCYASTNQRYLIIMVLTEDFTKVIGTRIPLEKYLNDNYGTVRPGSKEVMKTYKDFEKAKTSCVIEEEAAGGEEAPKKIKHYKKGKRIDQPAEMSMETVGDGKVPSEPMVVEELVQVAVVGQKEGMQVAGVGPGTEGGKQGAGEGRGAGTDNEKRVKKEGKMHVDSREVEEVKNFLPGMSKMSDSGVIEWGKRGLTPGERQLMYKTVQQEKPYTKLYIKDRWETTVEGCLLNVVINRLYIVLYTHASLLYIVWAESGRRAEIPLKMENVSKLHLDKNNNLLVLEANGRIKVPSLLQIRSSTST